MSCLVYSSYIFLSHVVVLQKHQTLWILAETFFTLLVKFGVYFCYFYFFTTN